MSDMQFADGFIFKRNENAPDYVIGKVSIKVAEFLPFMEKNHQDGWVNLEIKRSKGGKVYTALDTWKPERPQNGAFPPPDKGDDVPW